MLLITHDLDTLHTVCDRVAVLADKRVIAIGTIEELVATDHPWIQSYFLGVRGRLANDADARRRPAAGSATQSGADDGDTPADAAISRLNPRPVSGD